MSAARLAWLLIRLACRSLPEPDRPVRYKEWTAEAAAILNYPGTRSGARRKVRALLFAADHIRGTRRMARHEHIPRTGLRVYAPVAFQWVVEGIAFLSTRWLPVAYLMRMTLFELMQVAGMTYQIVHERRHWLAASRDEFEQARAWRTGLLGVWWTMLWIQLAHRLALNMLVGAVSCGLSAGLLVPRLERQIFARPGPAPDGQT